MSEEKNEVETTEEEPENRQRIQVGLSPIGGIGINVTDVNGDEAGIILSIEEAEQIGARLIGLSGMLVHMGYMEMAREQMAHAEILKKIKLP